MAANIFTDKNYGFTRFLTFLKYLSLYSILVNTFEQPPDPNLRLPQSWPHVEFEQRPRLVYLKQGAQRVIQYALRPTTPEAGLCERKNELLETLANTTEGINLDRVKTYITSRGFRIAPFRLLNEADTRRAERMGEIEGVNAGYKASYDVVLVPRHPKIEAINGPELTESILVHEFSHGANEYHDLVYVEEAGTSERVILHSRSRHRVYDCHENQRGRLIEEANAERERGKYVEDVLKRPFGFTKDVLRSRFYYEGGAAVDARYTVRRIDGKPYVISESFGAQALDLLCRLDPGLEQDLDLSRKSVEGLRNVAKRLNRIHPGLYVYMRDMPYGREYYRQFLVYVQRLVGYLPKQKAPSYDRTLGLVGDEGLEPPTLSV